MTQRILLCFVEQIEHSSAFKDFVSPFHEHGMELHLINGVIDYQIQPHHVINILEEMFQDRLEDCEFYLLSNIPDFFQYMYILYHETFQQFIFYNEQALDYQVDLESFYAPIIRKENIKQLRLHKTIYTNCNHQLINWLSMYPCSNVEDHQLVITQHAAQPLQRLFYIEDSYYLFEAVSGESVVINTAESAILPSIEENLATFVEISNLQLMQQLCRQLDSDRYYFLNNQQDIETYCDLLEEKICASQKYTKNLYIKSLELMSAKLGHMNSIFLQSFLLHITQKSEYLENMLDVTANSSAFQAAEKYFLLFRYIRFSFLNSDISPRISTLLRKLYHDIFEDYKHRVNQKCTNVQPIPKESRNPNLVFVFTSQFLDLNHGPTKTALDRCYQLMKYMGKQVILINTAELLTFRGIVPFHKMGAGNVNTSLYNQNSIAYKDIEVPFYQPSAVMPDEDELLQLMEIVTKYKPYLIIGISGTSIATDLCGQLVPAVSISTVNSSLQTTKALFDVIGRPITEHDIKQLALSGKTAKNIIESVFTFDFKPQQQHYTREQLHLPKNEFLLAIIGGRLNQEVTEELLQTLLATADTHLVFIGKYNPEQSKVLSQPENRRRYTYLGFQEDVLAILEHMNLYINPLRVGGATSAVEALYKGVPVLTLKHGDVYVAVGDSFAVDSFESMKSTIQDYVQDRQFYEQKSAEALTLAQRMMNTRGELERILKHVESSELFF